jgi:hypothetical protein
MEETDNFEIFESLEFHQFDKLYTVTLTVYFHLNQKIGELVRQLNKPSSLMADRKVPFFVSNPF